MTNKFDDEMRSEILVAIRSIPSLKWGDFEVYVNSGVVTLSGSVRSYQNLFDLESRVGKVPGIHGLYSYIQSDVGTARAQRRTVGERRCAVRDRRALNDGVTT